MDTYLRYTSVEEPCDDAYQLLPSGNIHVMEDDKVLEAEGGHCWHVQGGEKVCSVESACILFSLSRRNSYPIRGREWRGTCSNVRRWAQAMGQWNPKGTYRALAEMTFLPEDSSVSGQSNPKGRYRALTEMASCQKTVQSVAIEPNLQVSSAYGRTTSGSLSVEGLAEHDSKWAFYFRLGLAMATDNRKLPA